MKKLFLCCVSAVAIFLASCSSYGEKITISDKVEVYIKGDGATEEDAKKLGVYLDTTWKEQTNKKSFQLIKENDTYNIHMVADEKQVKEDPTLDGSFKVLRMLIAMSVFPDNKVNLVLTNNTFEPFKTFGAGDEAANSNETTAPDSAAVK